MPGWTDIFAKHWNRPSTVAVWNLNRLKEISVKHQNTLYWILTSIMAAFMSLGAVADVFRLPTALAWFMHLGYPAYLLPFIGFAKIIGVTVVLAPGIRRLREWAYAGLVFDLVGAFYSHISVGDPFAAWILPVIGLLLVVGSYALYRRRTNQEATYVFAS